MTHGDTRELLFFSKILVKYRRIRRLCYASWELTNHRQNYNNFICNFTILKKFSIFCSTFIIVTLAAALQNFVCGANNVQSMGQIFVFRSKFSEDCKNFNMKSRAPIWRSMKLDPPYLRYRPLLGNTGGRLVRLVLYAAPSTHYHSKDDGSCPSSLLIHLFQIFTVYIFLRYKIASSWQKTEFYGCWKNMLRCTQADLHTISIHFYIYIRFKKCMLIDLHTISIYFYIYIRFKKCMLIVCKSSCVHRNILFLHP